VDWDLALNAVQFGLWLVLGVYTWLQSRHQATQEQVTAIQRDISELAKNHAELEERVRHAPSARAVNDLSTGVAELKGELRAMRDTLALVNRQYERLDAYLRRVDP
jgi:predicted  nucleic acid-binding Zn-ribbon protein